MAMDFAFSETPEWQDSAISGASTEVLTFRRGQAYLITMVGPQQRYRMYLPGFDTILGTWRWA
jgi:hypothetical protein